MSGLEKKKKIAIWAVTEKGVHLAVKLAENLKETELYFSSNSCKSFSFAHLFDRLSLAVKEEFSNYTGHVFIMSTGIVIRIIAPLIKSKVSDPAVVVMDELGYHAISLLSGHIGGANELAETVARITGAEPVITTATDINKVPAIDLIAKKLKLYIENPGAIKNINMAFLSGLSGKKIIFHDPLKLMIRMIPESYISLKSLNFFADKNGSHETPSVFIDDVKKDLPEFVLVLRPPTLVAGIGCNRDTSMEEMKGVLFKTFEKFSLARQSLKYIASIDIKNDEIGLIDLAKDLDLPIRFFSREELNQVEDIKTPSNMVKKHIGVKSVCEAAAILASSHGKLIVPKQIMGNVTTAIARISSI